jgi:hypothetical protein
MIATIVWHNMNHMAHPSAAWLDMMYPARHNRSDASIQKTANASSVTLSLPRGPAGP